MSWKFFVRHYADDRRQEADKEKRVADPFTGKWSTYYPRAAALGGCTAHNAMIFMAPHSNISEMTCSTPMTGFLTSIISRNLRSGRTTSGAFLADQ